MLKKEVRQEVLQTINKVVGTIRIKRKDPRKIKGAFI